MTAFDQKWQLKWIDPFNMIKLCIWEFSYFCSHVVDQVFVKMRQHVLQAKTAMWSFVYVMLIINKI